MTALHTPSLAIEDPRGHRVTVAPRSGDDRVGDLADALGLDPRQSLWLDGRAVGRHETLAAAGVVHGSRLHPAPPAAGPLTHPAPPSPTAAEVGATDPVVTVVGEAGPGAGTVVHLPPGRHVVGRSTSAAVSVADPAVEPHHALLDVDADGSVRFVQLAGRVTGRIAGEPVASPAVVPDGEVLVLGASRLRIGRAVGPAAGSAVLTATPGDPWRRTLRRTPRPRPRWEPAPIPVPAASGAAPRQNAIGLLAAAMTLLGSVVIAFVMGSPMFLLFGLVGVLASVGMWLAGRVGAARDGRRAGAGRARDVAAFTAAVEEQRAAWWRHHVAVTPSVAEAITAGSTVRADVWARRAEHDDAFRATVGWGPVAWEVAVESTGPIDPALAGVIAAAERVDDAAVPADLGPGAALAVGGVGAAAAVRSLIVQLATWIGPADWRLLVVADDPAEWDWCAWLPHAAGAGHVVAADDGELLATVLTRADDGDARHVVVVTDRPDLLAQRTGPLRRFIGAAPSIAVIVALPAGESPPAMCGSVLEIGSIGVARWWADTVVAHDAAAVHAAGVSPATAAEVARTLAGLHDPEDPAAATTALAASIGIGTLSEQHGAGPIDDAIAIAAAWRGAGDDPAPAAAIGLTADGVVEIDLARDGPHALIAGTTGSGKSELLRTLVASLAARSSPDHLTFVLVDYKGGSTFDACADLPHTVGVVTDLDDRLAERALVSLDAEIRRRERLLRAVGADDLTAYRAVPGRPPLPRLVVVIDEFAALAADLPSFLPALVGVAQRGRSLGIHLVLATQRPAGVVSDDIRANTNLRVALRLHDAADARDVVGDDGPAAFPRGTPGRTMLRLGPGETVVFQSARSTGPVTVRGEDGLRVVDTAIVEKSSGDTELTVLVRSIRNAAALSDIAAPHRPWLPPLPARLDQPTAPAVVGIVDVPAEQRQSALCWRPGDGNVALLGGRGSGTTTALMSLIAATCRDADPSAAHVYLIDARGDERLDELATLPHCAGVVRPHERERLARMLRRIVADLDDRRAAARSGAPDVIVAVDGMPALRAVLDTPRDTSGYDALQRIVAEGASVGIACLMTGERPGAIPAAMLAGCADRWIFHLDDPAEAGVCGVPAALVPGAVPGRVVVASSRLEAQLAVVAVPAVSAVAARERGPAAVGVLPVDVNAGDLPSGRVIDGDVELVAGIDFETLAPAVLAVPDGEHILVVGPARSGRSTALTRLAASWRDAHLDGTLHVVAPMRRSPLASWPECADVAAAVEAIERSIRPCLLVIDDAERVDDAGGALAALAAERRHGLLIMAAGRPDALRGLGHWTSVIRRSRTGLLMAGCADVDGDLLGELLPRHPPLPARPGLAWVVGGGRRALVQVGRQVAVAAAR